MCVCVCVYVRGHPCDTQFTKKRCGQRSPGFKMRAATAATGKRKGGKKNSVTLFIFSFKEQKTVLVFLISFFTFVSLLFVTVVTYRTLKKKTQTTTTEKYFRIFAGSRQWYRSCCSLDAQKEKGKENFTLPWREEATCTCVFLSFFFQGHRLAAQQCTRIYLFFFFYVCITNQQLTTFKG